MKKQNLIAPKFNELIIARPEKMSYEDYKKQRREQSLRLKARLRGFMVWGSKSLSPSGENRGALIGKVPTVRIDK